MNKVLSACLLACGLCLGTSPSYAIPGQSVDEAKAWMQAHPTLRASPRERLVLSRADTPSRRFTFQASVFPAGGYGSPGILTANRNLGIIRVERFTLIDLVDGVTPERLEESLRVLYGADIYADYRRAQAVYIYPDSSPTTLLRPSRSAVRGELLEGDDFGYWFEVLPDANGVIQTGIVSILLKEDIPRLQTFLAERNAVGL
jgi:hypothetical protein